jgi:hypothetical protein
MEMRIRPLQRFAPVSLATRGRTDPLTAGAQRATDFINRLQPVSAG